MPFPTSVWFAFAKVATARTCSTGAEALFERIRPIVEEVRAKQDSLARHDRAFFDENWGEKM
jgi:hypothetical protein